MTTECFDFGNIRLYGNMEALYTHSLLPWLSIVHKVIVYPDSRVGFLVWYLALKQFPEAVGCISFSFLPFIVLSNIGSFGKMSDDYKIGYRTKILLPSGEMQL